MWPVYDSAGTQEGYSTYLLTEKKTSTALVLKDGILFTSMNVYSKLQTIRRAVSELFSDIESVFLPLWGKK